MKKQFVLKKNYEFDDVINTGKKVSNKYYSLFFKKSNLLETFKIGISVGKKSANAPQRNRQRRIVRTIIMANKDKIKNYEYVIISRPSALKLSYAEQEFYINQLFERLNNEK